LGRGLGALIPEIAGTQPDAAVATVPVKSISPNPFQPRTDFDDDDLEDLVASIQLHGVLQPVIVNVADAPDRYVLIAGERRWRAALKAGLDDIPALIKDATPQEMLEFALVENVVRSDLSPLEEAVAYRQLIDEFGLTQLEVAQRVGRSRVSVTNTLRLLFAPDAVKQALQSARISEGHARALLSLPSAADQVAMLETVMLRDLTVRQTESAVRAWTERQREPLSHSGTKRELVAENVAAADRLQRSLSTQVTVRKDPSGRGVISIKFDSDEQFEDLVNRISGESLF
jgi:ParB family chromosome partitioning protein